MYRHITDTEVMTNMSDKKMSKVKLLRLYDILRNETDEDHPMTTKQLCDRLDSEGICCDRRTLKDDIGQLRDAGYEIMDTKIGYINAYYFEDRPFSVPELKILIDAVQAASFITDKKSAALVDKIAELGGYHRADVLKGNMVNFNTRKHTNESILINVDHINEAILNNRKISFQYYDLDENHDVRFRKNRKKYIENPVTLVYNEDNYYLICYSDKYADTVNYRVDRMYAITVLDAVRSKETDTLYAALPDYTKQTFKMYDGDVEEVTLEFDNTLLGPIYDKFGEHTDIRRMLGKKLRTTVTVQVSPPFWGWLFQFDNRIRIVEPKKVLEEYKEKACRVANK